MHNGPRKYNLEPYWFHTLRVGQNAETLGVPFGLERGLCHDLVEDVAGFGFPDLTKKLDELGYNKSETDKIVTSVYHLTDIYTSESFPDLNRNTRKKLEAERLWKIPPEDQTIKYCDLRDNTETIVPYDDKFAKVYMLEKRYILEGMNLGDNVLYRKLCDYVAGWIRDNLIQETS